MAKLAIATRIGNIFVVIRQKDQPTSLLHNFYVLCQQLAAPIPDIATLTDKAWGSFTIFIYAA